jgi:hypothetical protein
MSGAARASSDEFPSLRLKRGDRDDRHKARLRAFPSIPVCGSVMSNVVPIRKPLRTPPAAQESETPTLSGEPRSIAPSCGLPLEHADYWQGSRQPLASLVFVLPILSLYEIGVVWLGPQAIRNGVDVWLRTILEHLDFGQYFLLPVLSIGLLLGWHHTTRLPWRVPRGVMGGMVVESILLAIGLRIVLQLESLVWHAFCSGLNAVPAAGAASVSMASSMSGLIGFLGAGVYEEFLFRLVLLSGVVCGFRRMGMADRATMIWGVLLTSLLFSAAHYVGAYGEPVFWSNTAFWFGAIFRFLAGVFFGALFVCRGFGIAVGAHAAYDILIKLI